MVLGFPQDLAQFTVDYFVDSSLCLILFGDIKAILVRLFIAMTNAGISSLHV